MRKKSHRSTHRLSASATLVPPHPLNPLINYKLFRRLQLKLPSRVDRWRKYGELIKRQVATSHPPFSPCNAPRIVHTLLPMERNIGEPIRDQLLFIHESSSSVAAFERRILRMTEQFPAFVRLSGNYLPPLPSYTPRRDSRDCFIILRLSQPRAPMYRENARCAVNFSRSIKRHNVR